MRILVTGGAGYIGSVVTEELIAAGHDTVVYDNLSKGHRAAVHPHARFVEADLRDGERLRRAFREQRTEAVVHMAADSTVGESVENPSKYYDNNVAAGLSLLDAMRECGVARIVFSSTAAVYGEPEKLPLEESGPTNPTNPYGETKLAFEGALKWYDDAYELSYVSLRYFNAAGASERFGEDHEPESHLIPVVLQAAAGRRAHVEIYGTDYLTRDGTCVRDYIHVVDLARAHVAALSARVYRGADLSAYTFRQRLVIRAADLAFYLAIRLIGATIRFEDEGWENHEEATRGGGLPIYNFWHERIFLTTYWWRERRIVVLTSRSFDGEYIVRCIQRFGYGAPRGD